LAYELAAAEIPSYETHGTGVIFYRRMQSGLVLGT